LLFLIIPFSAGAHKKFIGSVPPKAFLL
jgi:hypothetical protein